MSQTKPAPKPIPLPSVSVARALFVPLVVSVVGTLATNAFYGSHVIEPPAPPAPEPIEAMVLPIAPVVVGDPAAVRLPEGLHDPHWLVVQQPEKPHVPVVDYSDGNRTAHVSTATPGSYRIVAFGELDGKVVGWDGDLKVVGGVPTPAPPEPSPTPTPPAPPAPEPTPQEKATAISYVYEKDDGPVPAPVLSALNRLNRETKVVATVFERDTKNGKQEVPEQYKHISEAAEKAGLPALVVLADDKVLRVVKSPTTEEAVMEAAR